MNERFYCALIASSCSKPKTSAQAIEQVLNDCAAVTEQVNKSNMSASQAADQISTSFTSAVMKPVLRFIAVIIATTFMWKACQRVTNPDNYSFGKATSQTKHGVKCRSCNGTGWFKGQKCLPCGGDGVRGN